MVAWLFERLAGGFEGRGEQIFEGLVMLAGAGAYALLAPLPFIGIILLTAFELLVAFLQAYVFAILTCVYLNDAIHPGH